MTWRTVDIVVAAAIAVAFGVVFVAWNALWVATVPLFTALPPAQALIYGVWLLPGVLVGLIVRRPGAALFGAIVAAVVSVLIGSVWSLDAVVSGILQGAGAELVFAATRYRSWSLPTAAAAGGLAGVAPAIHDYLIYYRGTGVGFFVGYLVALVISGIVIGGVGAWYLVRALATAGVLGSFAAGREQPEV